MRIQPPDLYRIYPPRRPVVTPLVAPWFVEVALLGWLAWECWRVFSWFVGV